MERRRLTDPGADRQQSEENRKDEGGRDDRDIARDRALVVRVCRVCRSGLRRNTRKRKPCQHRSLLKEL